MKLEEIRSLLEKVTPGPWTFDGGSDTQEPSPSESELVAGDKGVLQSWDYEGYASGIYIREPDAQFIALSRTLVPALLEIAEAAKTLDHLISMTPDMRIPGMFKAEVDALKARHLLRKALTSLESPCP